MIIGFLWQKKHLLVREESDYSDFIVVSGEDAEAQVKTAEETIQLVENFLKEIET